MHPGFKLDNVRRIADSKSRFCFIRGGMNVRPKSISIMQMLIALSIVVWALGAAVCVEDCERTVTLEDNAGKGSPETGSLTRDPDMEDPVADAGEDRTIDQGTTLTFNGSGSTDNVAIDNYTWTLSDSTLDSLYGVSPVHTFQYAGLFEVILNVTDEAGNWDTDIMNVTVNDTAAPEADAGLNVIANQGDTVTLNGSGSTDNVEIVNYTWTFTDDGEVSLYGVDPAHTFENAGTFEIQLNVSDAAGNSDTDLMTLTINDTESPKAIAGSDREVYVGDTVTFNASGSTDNVGIFNYTWSFQSGGPRVYYSGAFDFVFDGEGSYTITLNVTDAAGNWALDTMVVTVMNASVPRAVITPIPGSVEINGSLTFDASGSTAGADSVIETYGWRLYRMGDTVSMVTGESIQYNFTSWGIYEMRLTIIDSSNASANTSVMILVGDLINFTGLEAKLPDNGSVIVDFGSLIESHYEGILGITWWIEHDEAGNVTERKVVTEPADIKTISQEYSMKGEYELSLEFETAFGPVVQKEIVTILGEPSTGNALPVIELITPPEGKTIQGKGFILDATGSYDPDDDLNGNGKIDDTEMNNLTYSWHHRFGNVTELVDPYLYPPVSDPPGMRMLLKLNDVGEHVFILTVRDKSAGENSTNITITVKKDTTDFTPAGHPDTWDDATWAEWHESWKDYRLDPLDNLDGDEWLNYEDSDIDGDGFWNQDELDKGSDPTDPKSVPGGKKEEDTNCTLLVVLVIIFVVILLMMIMIFTRGKESPKASYKRKDQGGDFL